MGGGHSCLRKEEDIPRMNRLRQRFPLMPLSWFEIFGTNSWTMSVRYPHDARCQDMVRIGHDFRKATAGYLEQTRQEAFTAPHDKQDTGHDSQAYLTP